MAHVVFKNINKVYPNGVQAVFDFNLEINDSEFIVLVGPSGCGKSTTLRMLAGLEEITSGELYIDDKLINTVAPKDRDIAMVFQNYALYPHMTVYKNIAFALKLRKESKEVIDEKVNSVADKLGLKPYLDRKPRALSSGQRQRVALGRAIVRDAKVFLMDEPLSNLDAKLRVTMRSELIKLHKSLGNTTTIYVTHDQTEAMTMATRIVVMKDGYIQQVGVPEEIYEKPVNMFVAGFIGTPTMNFVEGVISEEAIFETETGVKFVVPKEKMDKVIQNNLVNQKVILGIRPEDIYTTDEANIDLNSKFTVKVEVVELLGATKNLYFTIGKTNLCATVSPQTKVDFDDEIDLVIDMKKCHIFEVDSQKCITSL